MTTPQDTQQYIRRAAVDGEGNRIGKITKVYLGDQTGQPEWILVETGLFGTRQSFAPIRGSRFDGEQLVVLAVTKDQVKDAPNIDPDARIQDITVAQQQRVEILKALFRGAEILVLDEPTAVLTPQ